MSDYLKELEDEKNKLFEINPVAYEEIERVWDIDNIIKGYKKGCKDTEDKILKELIKYFKDITKDLGFEEKDYALSTKEIINAVKNWKDLNEEELSGDKKFFKDLTTEEKTRIEIVNGEKK
jgi:hypothetical protein